MYIAKCLEVVHKHYCLRNVRVDMAQWFHLTQADHIPDVCVVLSVSMWTCLCSGRGGYLAFSLLTSNTIEV